MEAVVQQTDKDNIEANPTSKHTRNWRDLVEVISYKGIVSNIPYMIFVTILCIIYITNTNKAISLTKELNSKNNELKELDWKYRDIQSRLMFQTSETQLIPKAEKIGLKPLSVPAYEIRWNQQENNKK